MVMVPFVRRGFSALRRVEKKMRFEKRTQQKIKHLLKKGYVISVCTIRGPPTRNTTVATAVCDVPEGFARKRFRLRPYRDYFVDRLKRKLSFCFVSGIKPTPAGNSVHLLDTRISVQHISSSHMRMYTKDNTPLDRFSKLDRLLRFHPGWVWALPSPRENQAIPDFLRADPAPKQ